MTGRRVVLVTGGGRGVGRAIVRAFAERGAHVIINYFHSGEAAAATLQEMIDAGGSAELIRASVAKPDDVRKMFATVRARHGRLDVLVNNAARGVFAPLAELDDADWDRSLRTNLHGARWCAQEALPLLANRAGCVVNLSSSGATHVVDNYALVGVAKAALEALTRYQAGEFAPLGVRVNVVSSPPIDNHVLERFPDAAAMKRAVLAATPAGRLTTEEDMAGAVVAVASHEARWITGQTIVADGGLSLGRAQLSPPRPVIAPARTRARTDVDPVAVVGMGVVLPGVDDVDEFWQLLHGGEPVFTDPGDRFRLADFRSPDRAAADKTYADRFGVIPDGVSDEDHSVTWLRRCLNQVRESVSVRDGDRHGLFAGAWVDSSQHLEEALVVDVVARGLNGTGPRLLSLLRTHFSRANVPAQYCLPGMIPRLAMRGILPEDTACVTVDTACSSSLYSIDLGMKALLDDEVDIAYCGGVSSFGPRYHVIFAKLNGLSASGDLRAFDERADGTVFSDGAGMIALKRLSRARADGDDVLAVLAGLGAASDGGGAAIYAPNSAGQRLALNRARSVNGVLAHEVDLVVAHGTGTTAGDSTELASLTADAQEREVVCVSNKSLVGHTGCAAGVVSVVHGLLCLRHELVPAQRRFHRLPEANRSLPVHVPTAELPFPLHASARPRVVGVSSFGFGGTNAHLLLQDPGERPGASARPVSDDDLVFVGWSAHLPGDPAREAVAARLAAGLPPAEERTFGDIYPEPPFDEVRMSRRAVRAIDRTHLMALRATTRFAAENGPLWTGVEEATGVVAAHCLVLRSSVDNLLRCYGTSLRRLFAGRPEEAACARLLDGVAARVPATSEDTMPGMMPNVIASRIANRLNLRGLSLAVDSGRDSGLAALHVAAGYLRRGELDLALVLGVNGNSTDIAANQLGLVESDLAEGAFLLAVARRSTAERRGWPVLGELRTRLRAVDLSEKDVRSPMGVTPSYGGADAIVATLGLLCGSGSAVVRGNDTSPAAVVRCVQRDHVQRTHVAQRYRAVVSARPGVRVGTGVPAIPSGSLLLVGSAQVAARLADVARAAGAVMVSADPAAAPHATIVLDVADHSIDALVGQGIEHIRVVVSFHDTVWPGRPEPRLLALQELLFLAAKRSAGRLDAGGSLAVLLLDPQPDGDPHPHTGLFTGFVKSIVWELPRCQAFALTTTTSDVATALTELADESAHRRGLPTVRLRHGVRLEERLEPVDGSADGDEGLTADSVVVATGGARGLTAVLLSALAKRHGCRMWILGTTDLDAVPTDVLEADDLKSRRAAFIAENRVAGVPVAELNRRFDRLVDANEARRNIDRLRRLCGEDRVRYVTCDVTDAEAVRRAAEEIREPIDLFVHGAGLHRAAGLAAKTLDVFRSVRGVKVLGHHHLRSAFPDVRRWCNFGSLVGVVGLPGEADYAPANEVLSMAARRSSDEFTLSWTIWGEAGMAARGVVDSFAQRQDRLSVLSNDEGVEHFIAELARPRAAADAVITTIGDNERRTLALRFPHLELGARRLYLGEPEADGRWALHLNASADPVLTDHLVHGLPTVPGTFVLEIAAEAALTLVPGARVHAFRDAVFKAFLRGGDGVTYRVAARKIGEDAADTTVRVEVTSEVLRDGRLLRKDRPHAHVDVVVTTAALVRPSWAPRPLGAQRPVADPYQRAGAATRFSGMFLNTSDMRVSDHGAAARWRADVPSDVDSAVIPAVMLDALARTAWLSVCENRQGVAAPGGFAELRLYTTGSDVALAANHPGGVELFGDALSGPCTAVTRDGVVLARIEGIEVHVLDDLTQEA